MWPMWGHPFNWDLLFTYGIIFYIVGYKIPAARTSLDTVAPEQRSCSIDPVFPDSPYIRAFKEVTEDGHGCSSNQTINGMEVHVIYFDNHLKHNTDVYLEIIANIKHPSPNTQFIFILSSRKQITWKIRLPNIKFTAGKHLIVTHLRSSVRFSKKVNYVDINKRGDFPTRAKTLFEWVNTKYRAITSFTKFKAGTRLIRARVGPVPDAPLFCNMQKRHTASPHAVLINYLPIPFGGCTLDNNKGYSFRTIHIIEVTGSNGSPLNEIIVELRPHNGKNPNVNIIIVLKATDPNVVWVIRSRKIMGSLEIYSNNRVNTDRVMMQRVVESKENLFASGLQLVHWVQDHALGFVSSYTNVTRVDKFTLSVEGTPLDQSSNVDQPEKTDKKANHPIVSIPPFANPSKTKASFQAEMKTSCFPDGLVLYINSTLPKRYGLKLEQITLADSKCQAEEINNYYVLRSGYSQCGTVSHKSFTIKYSNQLQILQISPTEPIVASPLRVTHVEGSGNGRDNPSEDGSGSGHLIQVDDTQEDDEDFPPQNIEIHFSCSPRKKIKPNLEFHLDFFDDPLYFNHYKKFPFYSTKEKFIYVKAKVSGDPLYGVQITDCSLTENGRKVQPLLRNGCPVAEGSFSWQTNKEAGIQEFSFKVNPHVSENKAQRLSCQMIACARDIKLESGTWKTRQCIHPNEFCSKFNLLKPHSSSGHHFVNVISKGSFIVHSMKSHSRNFGFYNGVNSNQKGKQVIIQGLESGTVIGIAFSAFIIGVLLTATLWFIQVYTDPQKSEAKRKKGSSTTETSADSTPCSFSPISI